MDYEVDSVAPLPGRLTSGDSLDSGPNDKTRIEGDWLGRRCRCRSWRWSIEERADNDEIVSLPDVAFRSLTIGRGRRHDDQRGETQNRNRAEGSH